MTDEEVVCFLKQLKTGLLNQIKAIDNAIYLFNKPGSYPAVPTLKYRSAMALTPSGVLKIVMTKLNANEPDSWHSLNIIRSAFLDHVKEFGINSHSQDGINAICFQTLEGAVKSKRVFRRRTDGKKSSSVYIWDFSKIDRFNMLKTYNGHSTSQILKRLEMSDAAKLIDLAESSEEILLIDKD
jgi:hypothetical protein